MEYRKLGRTDLHISAIGLGTMTWGFQNTQADGFEQMDYALERGINFFDTAEMYAIPPTAKTFPMYPLSDRLSFRISHLPAAAVRIPG